MAISFFKTPKHRVFQYTPVYWDPEKEAREERLNPQKKGIKRGDFQKVLHNNRRNAGGPIAKFSRIIIIAAIATLLAAIFYFTKFIGIVMQPFTQ
ncbi:MAG: hypothetical protein LBH91_03540 [Prevotellaceae bacterium]|jgi:hypothetical protein|nr:hypothetical protein [Prevotellaceae bacterium]